MLTVLGEGTAELNGGEEGFLAVVCWIVFGKDVDEADAVSVMGGEEVSAEDEVFGLGGADEAGHADGAASAGDDAESCFGEAESVSRGACYAEVAAEGEFEAAAHGEAVEASQRRHWQPAELGECPAEAQQKSIHVGLGHVPPLL
jgi:hypothetical protein